MSTILVVDDRKLNRDLIATILRYRDHRVLEASDGAEALGVAHENHPDLIISDILMPNMDGFEFVHTLRQQADLKSVPVIFASAHYLSREAHALALKSGVEIVLHKPFEPETFLAAVDGALGAKYSTAPTAPPQELSRDHLRILSSKLAEKVNELRGANALLSALVEFGESLSSNQTPERLAAELCNTARRIVGAHYATVGIYDDSGTALQDVVTSGWTRPKEFDVTAYGAQDSLIARGVAARRALNAADLAGDPVLVGLPAAHPPARFALCAPIVSPHRVYGWICLVEKIGVQAFTRIDEDLIGNLAAQVGRAHENGILLIRSQQRALALESEMARHQRTAAALGESEERFRMIADTVPGLIWMSGPDGRCQFANRGWTQFTGCEGTAESAFRVEDFVHADDLEALRQAASLGRQERTPYSLEHRLKATDGNYRWFLHSALPRFTPSGEFAGAIGVLVDVDDRHALEAQLRHASKMEAVGQLTGGIAHDFNNLLTVILGSAESLQRYMPAESKGARLAEMIDKAGTRAAELTQRLLAFSRRQVLNPAELDLNALVEGIRGLLERTIGEDIELQLSLDTGLRTAVADRNQVETALLNLAVNARDAMPEGGKLTIETANVDLDEDYAAANPDVAPGQYAMLAVSDTGSGMPPDVLARACEPFFTTKEPGKGTGLGLSMIYGFARQSNGHLKIYSEPGRGTSVKLYLPCGTGKDPVAEANPSAEEALRGGSETILVVEDDAMVRVYVVGVLSGLGYAVVEAADGPAALAKLDAGVDCDLLLTDAVMPGGMDGTQLAAAATARRPGLKVLLSSGYAEAALRRRSIGGRDLRILCKPYRAADIAREVRAALDGARK